MMRHRRSPAVQHGGDADSGAEMLGVSRDRQYRLGRRPEQEIVDYRLALIGDIADWRWPFLPLDIGEAKLRHVAGPQPEARQQEQDRTVTSARTGGAVTGSNQPVDLLGRQIPGHIG